MNITQEPKHTVSALTRLDRAPSKKQIAISLMAASLALLWSPSRGMADGTTRDNATKPVPVSHGKGPAAVNLRLAGSFVILSKTGITDVYASAIVGNVGTSPITGAALLLACDEVDGTIYTVNAAGPACEVINPALLTAAISDMQTAYTDAAGRKTPNATELGAGNINGMTIVPGLYKWSSSVQIPIVVTLSGGPNDVWIFQVAGNLTEGNGAQVILKGGAQAKNIFWQVAGQTTLGTTANFKGVVLCQTLIAMKTGAVMSGRALAQTAVTLEMNAVTQPAD
jgi:hypothetical protein